MSNPNESGAGSGTEETMSGLFMTMLLQQTNMALMLLGKVPHPETGETLRDLDGARMFIDQLEMIEFKTRGNLSPQEDKLLKQSLAGVRMAFVDAVEHGASTAKTDLSEEKPKADAGSADPGSSAPATDSSSESRKKFSKSY